MSPIRLRSIKPFAYLPATTLREVRNQMSRYGCDKHKARRLPAARSFFDQTDAFPRKRQSPAKFCNDLIARLVRGTRNLDG